MGTPIEDPTGGAPCAACFPGGTPSYLWALITGMGTGNAWNPGDPGPPNGVWLLEQPFGLGCTFEYSSPDFFIRAVISAPNSSFTVLYEPTFDLVFSHILGACKWAFTNPFVNPVGHHYHSGSAQMFSSFAGVTVSMPDIADLIGHPKDSESFGDVFPVDGDTAVMRIGKRALNSNVLIKFNF